MSGPSEADREMAPSGRVIVVGGGVIGCSIAYHLAGEGVEVTVVERGKVGGAASGVAAGMVAALSESIPAGPTLDLALMGRSYLLDILPQLQEESGIDVEYIPSGILHLAFTGEEEAALKARLEALAPLDMGVCWLSPQEARSVEPGIGQGIRGGLHSPQEGHLNSRRLVRAFAQGAARRGATFLQDTEVAGLVSSGDRVTGVRLPSGDLEGDCVVLAPGAWAGQYGDWLGLDIPVKPVRGQIMAARILPAPIAMGVWRGMTYLVPKADGSIVMGTTQEEAGFRDKATLEGIAGILAGVIELVPGVAGAELHKIWAGLRPGSPDGSPILGVAPGWRGALLAAGHYRNGILMSAATGKLITDCIVRGEERPLLPFSLSRFSG